MTQLAAGIEVLDPRKEPERFRQAMEEMLGDMTQEEIDEMGPRGRAARAEEARRYALEKKLAAQHNDGRAAAETCRSGITHTIHPAPRAQFRKRTPEGMKR